MIFPRSRPMKSTPQARATSGPPHLPSGWPKRGMSHGRSQLRIGRRRDVHRAPRHAGHSNPQRSHRPHGHIPVGEDPAPRVRRTPSIDDLQGQRQLGLVHTKSTPSGGPGGHFSTPRCCPECPNVIPSEAEESKPVVGSRGTIHATRPCIKARCSSTVWLWDKVLRFLTAFGMTAEGQGL